MNPTSQPYQPGELPPVPPAFPGDAAAASLTAEQVQALRNRNYLRADSYTRADSFGRQDSGLSFYEYQIGDGDESPKNVCIRTTYPRAGKKCTVYEKWATVEQNPSLG